MIGIAGVVTLRHVPSWALPRQAGAMVLDLTIGEAERASELLERRSGMSVAGSP
jgi:hypothetical protein